MSFEARLIKKPEDAEALRHLCQKVFGSADGKTLLSKLCAARHPMLHTEDMTPHEHGQAEVVAMLWRFGALDPRPPEPQTTN